MSLEFRFDLPPEKAIAYLKDKGYRTTFDWREMTKEAHDTGFTVAKMADTDLLQDVHEAVIKAAGEGRTLKEFSDELIPLLQDRGWWGRQEMEDPETGETREVQLGSPRRLRTIFQTNLKTAYAAGHWKDIQENRGEFPYLMYDAVDDDRTRDDHAAWDGLVLPVDDEWWKTHYPPNGWNCRCSVIQLNDRMLARMGKDAPDQRPNEGTYTWENPRTGEVEQIPQGIEPGWNYAPGASTTETDLELLSEKLEKEDDLSTPMIEGLLDSYLFRDFFENPDDDVFFPVMRLDGDSQDALKTQRKIGVLSGESLKKNKDHHPDLTLDDYKNLPALGASPDLLLQVSDEKIIVAKKGDDYYLGVIKAAKDRSENFLVSFRKTNQEDIKALKKRGKVVREK